MDEVQLLEDFVHFHSYTLYILLHMVMMRLDEPNSIYINLKKSIGV